MHEQSIFTQSVHAGERGPRPDYEPAVGPIHHSVVYLYDDVERLHQVLAGQRDGYAYSRNGNPTTAALEQAMAVLEAGGGAVAFASGMAAIHAALLACGLERGDHIIAAQDLYGVTHTLLQQVLPALGLRSRFVEVERTEQVVAALEQERPRLLLLETLSNPLLKVADLPALVEAARRVGTRVVVDNTFASPYLLRPLELGADYVVHSLTKYLAGHDDVLGGVVVSGKELLPPLRSLAQVLGAVPGPNEAWLAHRGLKTLALRMRQHCQNAARVADWLEKHPRVERVYYPGLSSHPQHQLAARLLRPGAFGGMLAFELAARTAEAAIGLMNRLRLILPGTSLGCIHSLMLHPACSSHRGLSPEQRAAWGISEGLLRLSVGIEEAGDIIADLEQALG
ncbi:MAG: aminotransferase class I/II-fold pyridoxal phosphate-dependent enzyme [Chloroflexia bacterium]|nr:aminotransferase class I/II-fold pyridoxal phosphate-dependent enzyme [Chloroflexia bacterium]